MNLRPTLACFAFMATLTFTLTSSVGLASRSGSGAVRVPMPVPQLAAFVSAVQPQSGAKGVRWSEFIVVTFNAPMNPASVQAAWTSSELPGSAVNFSWNNEATQLRVTPKKALEYSTSGKTYAYSIGAGAQSAKGAPLSKSGTVYSFSTLKRQVTLLLQKTYTALPNTAVNTSSDATLGTDEANRFYRVFLDLDTSGLPATFEVEKVEFVSALSPVSDVTRSKFLPWPFTTLGRLRVYSTSFDGIPSYDTPVASYLGDLSTVSGDLSTSISGGYNIKAVLADGNLNAFAINLRQDVANPTKKRRTQIRLQFDPGPVAVANSQLTMGLTFIGLTYLTP